MNEFVFHLWFMILLIWMFSHRNMNESILDSASIIVDKYSLFLFTNIQTHCSVSGSPLLPFVPLLLLFHHYKCSDHYLANRCHHPSYSDSYFNIKT